MAIFDTKNKFRYKVLTTMVYKDKQLEEFLDDQGEMGWEAVSLEVDYKKDLKDKPCRWYRVVFKARY
jgi:hypothetical protein